MPVSNFGTEPSIRGGSSIRTQPNQLSPMDDLIEYLKDYAREKPEMAALWCFGIGFVLGWKLKPW